MRHIVYSTASMNALAEGDSVGAALHAATRQRIPTEFLVVASVETDAPLHHLDILPDAATIVWRGANELARQFRA